MVNVGGPETIELDDGWSVVTADGSLSAHFEHTIAVTEDGPEVLTQAVSALRSWLPRVRCPAALSCVVSPSSGWFCRGTSHATIRRERLPTGELHASAPRVGSRS